ncbi:MAG: hypothetical protein JOZ90_15455 [Alphaproteobacteria bacterium]|nr:hypothetical protein [Alphaproteobacteria bacterium]MBV9371694.1 hypothetical protein [Alphaproteobacteria bacterium]MBV9902470.1 hypothetical protein [Alphaproteobacteria bacterium]
MKSLIFAAALMLGGAAMAQDTTGTTGTDTTMTTSTTVTPSSTGPQAPGNMAPERDARGIPVVSDSAAPPPGWNEGARVGTATAPAATTTMPAATDLPPCTRKVTDHCVQTYERGRAPRG